MRTNTRYFAVTIEKNAFRFRIGSYEYGIECHLNKDLPSFIRFNWGIASWTKAMR